MFTLWVNFSKIITEKSDYSQSLMGCYIITQIHEGFATFFKARVASYRSVISRISLATHLMEVLQLCYTSILHTDLREIVAHPPPFVLLIQSLAISSRV